MRPFRHRALASSSALVFLSGAAALHGTMPLPLHRQQVRGQDALGAALLLIPQGVGTLLSRSLAGRYTDRLGPRPVAIAAFTLSFTLPFAAPRSQPRLFRSVSCCRLLLPGRPGPEPRDQKAMTPEEPTEASTEEPAEEPAEV
ncbi:hypothetical protein ACWGDX_04690 [Streptomyces sp. NPDC055025]